MRYERRNENIVLNISKRFHRKCHSKHSMMIHSIGNTTKASSFICAEIMGYKIGGHVCR